MSVVPAPASVVASKVPEVTAVFWVLKLLTTGLGETASDWMVVRLDPVPVVLATAALFAACLMIQLQAPRYVVWRYWLLVGMIGVFGTMVADVAHIVVGVPYIVSTAAFAVALAVVLGVWWRSEGTLSIHSITSRRREVFYWATVCATFALGTAVGDLAAHDLGLGYGGSAIVFGVLFLLPGLAYRFLGWSAVAMFWASYIVTRPLGASIADGLAVVPSRGGLGFGTGPVTLVALTITIGLVAVLARRHTRNPMPAGKRSGGAGQLSCDGAA
ncbi:hypothetical protein ASF68_02545 [Plantibacter sp. Leaf314]|nr:hypothetical protein ASF68_02545 [Plantibacter sp. Leaf314]